jgi:hypothetical protein
MEARAAEVAERRTSAAVRLAFTAVVGAMSFVTACHAWCPSASQEAGVLDMNWRPGYSRLDKVVNMHSLNHAFECGGRVLQVLHLQVRAPLRNSQKNMQRKAAQAKIMFEMLVKEMNNAETVKLKNTYIKKEEVPSWL